MHYKISQLILTPGQKANTVSEIYVAQPDSNKEALVGKLFVLVEIESKKVNDLKIINFLIENLNNNYYQNEKMILRERVKTVKVEHIFESALAKTNKNFAEFLRTEKIKLNPKLINATVGVIYENTLLFSSLGKNKAFLIYPMPRKTPAQVDDTKDKKQYAIADVIKQSEGADKKTPINTIKLFHNVISGHLPKNSYFVFTNEALSEYLSNRQMVEIITTLPPAGAAEQIKNSLSKINYYVSFLALIIKSTTGYEREKTKKAIAEPISSAEAINSTLAPATGKSVSSLNKMEEKTEELLTPQGLINFKKWLIFLTKLRLEAIWRDRPKKEIGAGALKDKIFFKKKTNLLYAKKIWVLLKNIALYLLNLVIYVYRLITDKKKLLGLAGKIKSILKTFNKKIKNSSQWFNNLNKKNKILLIIALGSILLFLQNLIVLHIKNNKIKQEQAYANLIRPIEQKQNQVEASLLYGNEDRARDLLNEIKELMSDLPRQTEEQINKYKTFEKKLNEQLEKIRHVVKIKNAKELAVLTNLNPKAGATNIILTADYNKIYAGDSGQKTIYSINVADNLITAITDLTNEIKALKYPALAKSENIYYFGDSNIIQLNSKTEEINILSINLQGEPRNIAAAAGYNNRLYLLDRQENQIYRFKKSSTGFEEPTAWLKEKADFSDVVDISIDGYIYILKSNGQLLKFLKGKKKDFELDIVEPAIEKATKVFVSPNLKYIYILEPLKQRLIIFNKTGDFLMQYQSDQFTDLRDFAVNEPAKKIYFLNGNSIYEVEGAHFEDK
jgi:hypothetical protein